MLIRLAYDIQFEIPSTVAMVTLLHIHPSRVSDLLEPDELKTEPALEVGSYIDSFGNRCSRFVAPPGQLRLTGSTLIRDSGNVDEVNWNARQQPVGDLPNDVLTFLLNSRYCEVDRFSFVAFELFGQIEPGWGRVQAICNWVHSKVTFNYQHARPTKTALDVFTERVVLPMDFSAWFEVYLEGRWWTFDARNNQPRIGRVLMVTGRDAADVAMTTSFGQADLRQFFVVAEEEIAAPLEK